MNPTKVLVAALVVLVAAGGAAAADVGTPGATTDAADDASTAPADVEADATYDNGTVTMTSDGDPVENASVVADDRRVGTTGANGTVTFQTDATAELELELSTDGFEGELEYRIQDGSLTLVEESYEYERGEDKAEDDEREEEADEDEQEENEQEADEDEQEDDEQTSDS